jgi:hypothetical protein
MCILYNLSAPARKLAQGSHLHVGIEKAGYKILETKLIQRLRKTKKIQKNTIIHTQGLRRSIILKHTVQWAHMRTSPVCMCLHGADLSTSKSLLTYAYESGIHISIYMGPARACRHIVMYNYTMSKSYIDTSQHACMI